RRHPRDPPRGHQGRHAHAAAVRRAEGGRGPHHHLRGAAGRADHAGLTYRARCMSERHRRQWEALGASDPYWAVLTDPTKRHGKWDKEEFFRTGAREIDGALSRAAAFGMPIRSGIALDYGCGVGRLTRALAERFERVIGVDISAAMLAQARAAT